MQGLEEGLFPFPSGLVEMVGSLLTPLVSASAAARPVPAAFVFVTEIFVFAAHNPPWNGLILL